MKYHVFYRTDQQWSGWDQPPGGGGARNVFVCRVIRLLTCIIIIDIMQSVGDWRVVHFGEWLLMEVCKRIEPTTWYRYFVVWTSGRVPLWNILPFHIWKTPKRCILEPNCPENTINPSCSALFYEVLGVWLCGDISKDRIFAQVPRPFSL